MKEAFAEVYHWKPEEVDNADCNVVQALGRIAKGKFARMELEMNRGKK